MTLAHFNIYIYQHKEMDEGSPAGGNNNSNYHLLDTYYDPKSLNLYVITSSQQFYEVLFQRLNNLSKVTEPEVVWLRS